MWVALIEIGKLAINGAVEWVKGRQAINRAVVDNKIRLAQSEQDYNHEWEMKALQNAGWKDDILFYAILGMFVYSAFDPEGAARVFKNWEAVPAWFMEITGWLVASVVGVKKVGDYLPGLVQGVKGVMAKKQAIELQQMAPTWTQRLIEEMDTARPAATRPASAKPSDIGRVFIDPANTEARPSEP